MIPLTASSSFDWTKITDEAVSHLRTILQMDTRNPPGNETQVAKYLEAILQQEGIECRIIGPDPDRRTLIARLRGDGSASPLLLMSHTDVVDVEQDKWRYDPFAATLEGGFIYARGALDMKHMVTMELMTMLLLKRVGNPLKRDLIFMAAADEEAGGRQGTGWVVKNCPELIQAEYALNEGGGETEINGRRYYTVQTAEKGRGHLRLRAQGIPGHASRPHDENAILKLASALSKLHYHKLPVHFTPLLREFIEGIALTQPSDVAYAFRAILADESTADVAVDLLPLEDILKQNLRAMMSNTVTPTMLKAISQINVIPSEAEALLDGRILPGSSIATLIKELRLIVGEEVEIDVLKQSRPLETTSQSSLFTIIKTVLKELAPQAIVLPSLLTAGSDAKKVASLGIKVYGFTPTLYEGPNEPGLVHGHNERISIRSLSWGLRVLYEVVTQFICCATILADLEK